MNIEALKQLRRVVEAAPDDRFHMRRWSEKAPCGTAYCAAGWAAIDPWFRENTGIGDIFKLRRYGYLELITCSPFFSLARLFDISIYEAATLFGIGIDPRSNPHAVSRAEVIANIDRILAGQKPERYAVLRREE